MNTSTHNMHSPDPRQLEREIDQKRDYIGDLVGALESRLSPGDLFERVLGAGKGNGGEFARNLGTVVKANPVPALLVSAGLVWLYASRNETPAPITNAQFGSGYASSGSEVSSYGASSDEGNFDRAAYGGGNHADDGAERASPGMLDRAAGLRDGAREKLHDASAKIGDTMHGASARVGESLHGAAGTLTHKAQQARGSFENLLQDNPMAVGAIAIAVGALLGAIMPTTEKENQLMGELGDKVTGKAKAAASTVYSKGADTVRELGTRVKSSASSANTAEPGEADEPAGSAVGGWAASGDSDNGSQQGASGGATSFTG